MNLYLISLILVSVIIGAQAFDECTDACTSCQSLSIFMGTKTCPNCQCLNDLKTQIEDNRCENKIDRSIYCPAGFEIDYKGCVQGYCKQNKKCDWTFMSKCPRVCLKGYLMGPDGCPTCECQCDNEGLSLDDFASQCADRCGKNDEITIEEDASGCRACICSKAGRLSSLCNSQDRTLDCKNSCGKWPRIGGCSENRCDCRCPQRGLTCQQVECPRGETAKLMKDEFGCEIGCKCSSEIKNSALCTARVTCPANCGPYDFREVRDKNGCMIDCHCQCPNPKCPISCPFGFKKDAFGCNVCECLSGPDSVCQGHCNITCGPYEYKTPVKDNLFGCRTDCKCNCPESQCPISCMEVEYVPNRFGCLQCKCKNTICPQTKCTTKCGPHPVVKRWDGCPEKDCRCQCPELKCPACPEGLDYLIDGYGCPTCQCKCLTPPPTDCPPCHNGYKVNKHGCQETCECAESSPRNKCARRDCSDVICPSRLFATDQNECDTCECCPIDVAKCPVQCKIFRANQNGCPICECA